MPQLDSLFWFGESVITLVLLYTVIYFYLFWFSKQNFEYWVVGARLNYYFEKKIIFLVYLNFAMNSQISAAMWQNYQQILAHDSWNNTLSFFSVME